MATVFVFARRHGLDALTFVVLVAAAYFFSQPLRDKWALHRAETASAKVADRKWGELAAVGAPLGASGAGTQVVEISDYQCPFCRKTSAAVDSAVRAGLHVVYLNYPLPIHAQAQGAALAAICAGSFGRFHEMHTRLMSTSAWETDSNWTREASAAGIEDLRGFVGCMNGPASRLTLSRERALADSIGVHGTPLFVSRQAIHRGAASSADLFALDRGKQ